MIQEFRDFINRGNVMDLAVAVVLAAAFTPIINAVVERVIMPIIGMIFGQPNFDAVGTFACESVSEGVEGIVVGGEVCAGSIGAVLTALVSFLLVALAVFFIVKAYNRMQGPRDEAIAGPSEEAVLLAEIRDTSGPAEPASTARRSGVGRCRPGRQDHFRAACGNGPMRRGGSWWGCRPVFELDRCARGRACRGACLT